MTALPQAQPLAATAAWIEHAVRETGRRNPLATALATANSAGRPSVRMVLLKHFDADEGYAVFYTHYESRKGMDLAANPRAACVLYWEELGRQLRLEGIATRAPAAQSDAYFTTRPGASQLNAWASRQSSRLGPEDDLLARALDKATQIGAGAEALDSPTPIAGLPRPPLWGGVRLWLDRIEFWVEGAGRFHDRIEFSRELNASADGHFTGSAWEGARLQP